MTIELVDIEQALDQVELLIRTESDYNYFLRHRDRYASDALVLSQVLDGSQVLEIGSIPGHFTALLSVLGVPCVGVDIDPNRLGPFSNKIGLDVRRCDIEREPLPFEDGSLTNVLFSEVFEHLRVDPLFALSELNRVLAVGGYMVLTTPNLYSVQQCLRFLSGRGFGDPLSEFMKIRMLGHMGHIREYSHKEICRFMLASGFKVEQFWFKHYYYGGGKRGLAKRVIFGVLPARFRTFQVLLVRKNIEIAHLSPLT